MGLSPLPGWRQGGGWQELHWESRNHGIMESQDGLGLEGSSSFNSPPARQKPSHDTWRASAGCAWWDDGNTTRGSAVVEDGGKSLPMCFVPVFAWFNTFPGIFRAKLKEEGQRWPMDCLHKATLTAGSLLEGCSQIISWSCQLSLELKLMVATSQRGLGWKGA